MSNNFGLDLLLESQKQCIKGSSDILIIVTHWILMKNKFRSVGIGDSKIYNENDKLSELLPAGWNQDKNYTMRYCLDKTIYILFGIVSEKSLVIAFLDTKTLNTTSITIDTEKIVKCKTGSSVDDYINDSEEIINNITCEIVQPMIQSCPSTSRGSQEPKKQRTTPRIEPTIPYSDTPRPARSLIDTTYDPLRNIGRGDLDPFGRGGGMIFQPDLPFRPGGLNPLPPLGVPPGARYDPTGPLGNIEPNPDHMRPPPGYDDMFM